MQSWLTRRGHSVLVIAALAALTSCAPVPPGSAPPPAPVVQDRTIGSVRADGRAVFLNRRAIRGRERIGNGNHVATGPRSSALIRFDRGGLVQLNEQTDPTFQVFSEAGGCVVRSVLTVGEIFADNDGACRFEIETPNGLITLRGQLNIRATRRRTIVTVLQGRARLPRAAAPRGIRLRQGERATLRGGRITRQRSLNPPELLDSVRWREHYGFAQRIRVPDLRQRDIKAARRQLRESGLRLGKVGERPDNRYPPGTILEQRPDPGSLARRGRHVDVLVAVVRWSEVPDLRGLMLNRARHRLRDAGLEPGRVKERASRKFRPGSVIGQSEPPGTRVRAGRRVDLFIAEAPGKPRPEPEVSVPAVRGVPKDRAIEMIRRSGLRVGKIAVRRTDKFKSGEVIRQSPRRGRRVARGTPVDLTIARRPDDDAAQVIRTPKFHGLSLKEATELARKLGIGVKVAGRRVTAGPVKPGHVIDQKPPPREPLKKGDVVSVWLQDMAK